MTHDDTTLQAAIDAAFQTYDKKVLETIDQQDLPPAEQSAEKAEANSVSRPNLSRLRPIAEAGPVPEGCERVHAAKVQGDWIFTNEMTNVDTHFADIILPTSEAEQKVDLYAELKAAKAAGKVIQTKWTNHGWKDNPSPDWTLPPERYRIKPEPETFEAHGKTWIRHTPGDPCPVHADAVVYVLTSKKGQTPASAAGCCGWQYTEKDNAWWGVILGWRYADEPQPELAQPWAPAVGDVVRLNSGGPEMTTLKWCEEFKVWDVGWFAGQTYCTDSWPASCLELVRKEKP